MSLFNGKFNSKYFKAYYQGKKRIVFVENEDDVPFWKRWLRKFAPSENFVVKPSVSGTSTRGKTEVLKLLGGEGAYMLLAVDSDDRKRKIAEYQRQKGNTNSLLNANIDYEACFLLEKIRKDVQSVFPTSLMKHT